MKCISQNPGGSESLVIDADLHGNPRSRSFGVFVTSLFCAKYRPFCITELSGLKYKVYLVGMHGLFGDEPKG